MRCYIGSPIDSKATDPGSNFKDISEVVVEVFGNKVVCFNPFSAFVNAHVSREPDTNQFVIDMNYEALEKADLCVFKWTDDPSFGTPLEMFWAQDLHRHVVVWNESTKKPGIYLQGLEDSAKKENEGSFTICNTREEVVKALEAIKEPKPIGPGFARSMESTSPAFVKP